MQRALTVLAVTTLALSLSLGAVEPFDRTWLLKLRRFLDDHRVPVFSEHLSYCSDDGQLYDLMPIPFTDEAVHHVAARIREVQDALGRGIHSPAHDREHRERHDQLQGIRADEVEER